MIGVKEDYEFVEEPLGLLAEQGYGFPQLEFGESIGGKSGDVCFQILRKLGWGMNSSVWLAKDKM